MKTENLIDYAAKRCPQHLHEIACRLMLAYRESLKLHPPARDSFEFIWRVFHDGEGLDKLQGTWKPSEDNAHRNGAITTPPMALYRAFHYEDRPDMKLTDEQMFDYIRTFSPADNILYPEDFDIVVSSEKCRPNDRNVATVVAWSSSRTIELKPDHPRSQRQMPQPSGSGRGVAGSRSRDRRDSSRDDDRRSRSRDRRRDDGRDRRSYRSASRSSSPRRDRSRDRRYGR